MTYFDPRAIQDLYAPLWKHDPLNRGSLHSRHDIGNTAKLPFSGPCRCGRSYPHPPPLNELNDHWSAYEREMQREKEIRGTVRSSRG
jgi:hypothetical protein